MIARITRLACVCMLMTMPVTTNALTMEQFAAICASGNVACSEHPVLQAYVGGALDLIAMLDEETEYLDEIYCVKPSSLFDVPSIIRYMEAHQADNAKRNAMLLLIRFLEENGGC